MGSIPFRVAGFAEFGTPIRARFFVWRICLDGVPHIAWGLRR